ncbi:VOC family protein [Planotetraspora sp. A-T 1434]|uniref:VOC family protein n=1 Tax=Planotetraspora sp. A-T 1434 TaxID=2979219 RepID=UPI0021C1179F|nr:VOC family protein [Planotetraspora sp. A-T 1434]MCT9932230.1 VOC family protein [Planotetraspora sp. A-T 1434]
MPSATGPQKITTFLMFEGHAEEAMTFYMSLFADSEIVAITRYGPGEAGTEGSVRHATFSLAGQRFMCIDSSVNHGFSFTPSISLHVECETEDEIDRVYAALLEKGQALMPLGAYGFSAKYGWVADRFGVAWQLTLAA